MWRGAFSKDRRRCYTVVSGEWSGCYTTRWGAAAYAPLLTADRRIRDHLPLAVWDG